MIALLAIVGAGFSSLDQSILVSPVGRIFAADKEIAAGKKKGETDKKSETRERKKKEKGQEQEKKDDSMFLQDAEKAIDYLPDIFRCPECGYEQDEAGTCPDHNTIELVRILSRGKDPLEPSELDGNEDIIVDFPLKDLQFRKQPDKTASAGTEVK